MGLGETGPPSGGPPPRCRSLLDQRIALQGDDPLTNDGIRGWLPRSICLVCLALMWLESVLGLCLGCEIHGLLVRRGWARKDEAYEICAHGACDVTPRRSAS